MVKCDEQIGSKKFAYIGIKQCMFLYLAVVTCTFQKQTFSLLMKVKRFPYIKCHMYCHI